MDEYDVERIVADEIGRIARELRRELAYEVDRLGWRLDDVDSCIAELYRKTDRP